MYSIVILSCFIDTVSHKKTVAVLRPLGYPAPSSLVESLRVVAEKEGIIQAEGTVIASLRDAMFRVKLDNGYELIAHTSGKIRKSKIRISVGDRVSIEVSTHGISMDTVGKGRIIRRLLKNIGEQPAS